jgi:cytosine/adenosine deaminase-related metal-dependent hydrolase
LNSPFILRSRIVVPVSRPPIEDGAVFVIGNRIASVGRRHEIVASTLCPIIDMGETVLLPGLINSHCHLDYTDMAGELVPAKSFTSWIQDIVSLKAQWTYSDYAESWLNGAKQLLHSGTTSVADIEAVPELLPEVWSATPLRVTSFLELIDVKGSMSPGTLVNTAISRIEALPRGRCSAGLSPHAPYSTSSELLTSCGIAAIRRNLPVTTHVAESQEEFEMFLYARGTMHDWLKRSGRKMRDCGRGSPVRHLVESGLRNVLAVHANYLWRDDSEFLARSVASVVHCPRSHAFFGHQCFPREELARAGVNLCLGTDSLATVRKKRGQSIELNLFAEMRALASSTGDLPSENILQMATVNGARALGKAGEIGVIAPGALADMVALPFSGKLEEAVDGIVHHTGMVSASMIDGEWALPPCHA